MKSAVTLIFFNRSETLEKVFEKIRIAQPPKLFLVQDGPRQGNTEDLDKIMACPTKPRVLLISTKNIVETSWQSEIDKWYPNQISYSYITGRVSPKERLNIINKPVDILALNTEMKMTLLLSDRVHSLRKW